MYHTHKQSNIGDATDEVHGLSELKRRVKSVEQSLSDKYSLTKECLDNNPKQQPSTGDLETLIKGIPNTM